MWTEKHYSLYNEIKRIFTRQYIGVEHIKFKKNRDNTELFYIIRQGKKTLMHVFSVLGRDKIQTLIQGMQDEYKYDIGMYNVQILLSILYHKLKYKHNKNKKNFSFPDVIREFNQKTPRHNFTSIASHIKHLDSPCLSDIKYEFQDMPYTFNPPKHKRKHLE